MERSVFYYVIFLLMCHFLCSGSIRTQKEVPGHVNVLLGHDQRKQELTASISTVQRDITTPITTIPNLVPTTPTISTSPFLNPNSNPDTVSPASTIPFSTPTTVNSPMFSGASWCIASPTASQTTLQVALDYACGFGGADCSAIQPGGSCYNPNSIRNHASYAFNKYYQKNPVPNSCNFGGTAVIISTNPSTGACQYPSTSTSTSVLNTTNSNGANVFGSVPVPTNPSPSSAAAPDTLNSFADICGTGPLLIVFVAIVIIEIDLLEFGKFPHLLQLQLQLHAYAESRKRINSTNVPCHPPTTGVRVTFFSHYTTQPTTLPSHAITCTALPPRNMSLTTF
ncbi:Glucan endo-1,3-beta-glucosidase 1 [Glycine soja]|nr:Glucan endo-1,3-beta-glucosidase 1 [Glycine soja]